VTLSGQTVAVIGLGAMGAALARSLVGAGAETQVWNRGPGRAEPLVGAGALVSETPAEAIATSDTVVVCLSNYAAWQGITDDAAVRAALPGKRLIQLTGGTIPEVEAHAALMAGLGVDLVEGAILCFPGQIGTDAASIIVAGDPGHIAAADPVLRVMSPRITDLGAGLTAPVILGRASVSSMLGILVGAINGAALCQAGGVPLAAYREQVAANGALLQSEALRMIEAIATGRTDETQASLAVWAEGHAALLDVASRLGTETAFHDGLRAMFEKALEAGLGAHDLSAMAAVFRAQSPD